MTVDQLLNHLLRLRGDLIVRVVDLNNSFDPCETVNVEADTVFENSVVIVAEL